MYAFKKALTPFLLPPGIFVVLLTALGIWSLVKGKRASGIANLLIAGLIWVFSIAPVSNALFRSLEADFAIPADLKADAIILLSGGVYDKASDLSGVGAPGGETLSRVVTTARLYNEQNLPVVVSGGKDEEDRVADARIIKRFLVDLGVPSEEIIVEVNSKDTIENAKYTKDICDRRGFGAPILITSAYHLKRSVRSFKEVGLDVRPFPCGFRSWQDRTYIWADYLPDRRRLEEISTAIREHLGLVFYQYIY